MRDLVCTAITLIGLCAPGCGGDDNPRELPPRSGGSGPRTGGSGGGAAGAGGSAGMPGGGAGGSGGSREWRSAVGERGALVRTFDGVRWNLSYPTTHDLHAVTCVGNVIGWAVGDAGVVLHTRDGGESWQPLPSGADVALRAVRFVDARVGWAVGDRGVLLATEDGGQRWQRRAAGTTADLRGVAAEHGGERAWVVGARGVLLASADGGATWQPRPIDPAVDLHGVAVDGAGAGWAVGSGGALYRLGGGDAAAAPSPTSATLRAVAVPHHGPGGPVAAVAVGDAGTVLVLAAGASSWQAERSGVAATLRAALVSTDGVYAAGDGGVLLERAADGGWRRIETGTTASLHGLEDL